jgi:hypothetical protein
MSIGDSASFRRNRERGQQRLRFCRGGSVSEFVNDPLQSAPGDFGSAVSQEQTGDLQVIVGKIGFVSSSRGEDASGGQFSGSSSVRQVAQGMHLSMGTQE